MNPYNIGDRVWTAKRGFGIIRGEMYFSIKRPYSVAFDADQNKSGFVVVRYPKRKNIESEEHGKFIMQLSEKIDAEALKVLNNPGQCTADHVIADGKKAWHDLLRELNTYMWPKFKSGDMADTELVRPWTPTKITHSHKMEELALGGFLCENVPLSKFSYAGKHISGKDIIFEHDPRGVEIWYGTKGDDI